MNRRTLLAIPLMLMATLSACNGKDAAADAHEHQHEGEHERAAATGAHGGRLLRDGDFALEVVIFERGVPPELRLYPMLDGRPLPPADVEASVSLQRVTGRPGGQEQRIRFSPRTDYLLGDSKVYEPHSFEVTVTARHAGQTHEWNYDSPEAHATITADMAAVSGIETATVGAGVIDQTMTLYGSVQANAERVRTVSARYPGVVREVRAQIGDRVAAGQTLASIEANESLQVYAVKAPIGGVVTRRHTNPGESAGTTPLFEIADYSSVWIELTVFPKDRPQLVPGRPVEVEAVDASARGSGTIGYLSPHGVGADGSVTLARAVLDNADGRWTPGQFVSARVTLRQTPASLVVPLSALQRFRDWDVVFAADGNRYQALPVTLGRRDAQHAEVLEGLQAGARIVVANAYLIKADIEKSGASHDH